MRAEKANNQIKQHVQLDISRCEQENINTTTTLFYPQGDHDIAKAESSRLPGLAAGTGRRGRGQVGLSTQLSRRIPQTISDMVLAKAT